MRNKRVLGLTTSVTFQDSHSSRSGVWGVDVTLARLETMLRDVQLRVADGVMFIAGGIQLGALCRYSTS